MMRHFERRARQRRSSCRHPIQRRNGRALCADTGLICLADNYLIDVKFGIIVDVEASRAIRQAEVGTVRMILERTQERFDLKPAYLAKSLQWRSTAATY
jgi:hypothetical protein